MIWIFALTDCEDDDEGRCLRINCSCAVSIGVEFHCDSYAFVVIKYWLRLSTCV